MRFEPGSADMSYFNPLGYRFASAFPDDSTLADVMYSPLLRAQFDAQGELGAAPAVANSLAIIRQTVGLDAIGMGDGLGGSIGQGVMAPFASRALDVFSLSTRLISGDFPVDLEELGVKAVRAVIQEAILPAVFDAINQAVQGVASAIPIVGGIVRFGMQIAQAVIASLRAMEDEKKPDPAQAMVYRRATDEDLTAAALLYAGGDDWTRVFLPASTHTWGIERVTYTPGGAGQGYRYGPGLGDNWDPNPKEAFGCLPGGAIVETLYQQPDTLRAQGGRDAGPENAITGAKLYPSLAQLGAALWDRVLTPGPRMFSVDTARVSREWKDYYAGFAELAFRHRHPRNRKGRVLLLSMAYHYGFAYMPCGRADGMDDDDGPLPGVALAQYERAVRRCKRGDMLGSALVRFGSKPKIPAEYFKGSLSGLPWGPIPVSNFVRWQLDEIWAKRARRALRTIVCAYVSEKAPAFRDRPDLAELHASMRRELLRHAARRNVELDMIPDREYRQAMAEAQDPGNWLSAPTERVTTDPQYKVARVLPGPIEPTPDAQPPALPDDTPEAGGGRGGTGAVLGGLVGVALLGLLARGRA